MEKVDMTNKRIINLIVFLTLTGIEILIALFVHDDFIRPYVGDIIVIAVIYYFVRIFFPDGLKYLLLYIFAFSVMIEFAQLLELTKLVSGNNRFLEILLGTFFSVWDIVCYAAGFIIVGIIETVIKKQQGKDNLF
jgi:hypothetical protein